MKIVVVDDPIIDFMSFDSKKREKGMSGFMRLRNEWEFLAQSIESWLPELDELVIVYNNCQDNTEEVVRCFVNKYPEKIKAYHYIPIVYPQGSEKYKKLNVNNPHSLVYYYNFALSKTTRQYAIKIDGDLIIPQKKRGG